MNKRKNLHFTIGNIFIPLMGLVLFLITVIVAATVYGIYAVLTTHQTLSPEFIVETATDNMVGLIYSLIQIILFAVILYFCRRRGKPYLFTRLPHLLSLPLLVVVAGGGVGLATLWLNLARILGNHFSFWAANVERYETLIATLESPERFLLMVLSTCILVPFAEELLFRGIVLSEFKLCLKPTVAAVMAGILFGLFHADWIQSIYAGILGIVLGLVYVWTESIWASIFMHIVFNLLGGALSTWLKDDVKGTAIYTIAMYALLVLSPFALVGLAKLRRKGETVARGSAVWAAQVAQQEMNGVGGSGDLHTGSTGAGFGSSAANVTNVTGSDTAAPADQGATRPKL
ncbi:CAAX amino terminal protease family protein [Mageeibacillus indolicus UPII9-5]|uniref:CAAX amino terminal protease family protein n=2 Tax=Mageeibacillus indolicus TaxID=884684 RepID=D3QZP0_MAGIU|nr:CPBP family intramembrane glutamic endopeptidase [Mageeibacillus indolicus]ADC91598.1 CAAX amino terminal protease family protein [Mageeibacillus indolicus UPII9-5]PNH18420.1 CPBP family intramembrane metalloprotease domain-containing protein [Mageeibacillus indolicus]